MKDNKVTLDDLIRLKNILPEERFVTPIIIEYNKQLEYVRGKQLLSGQYEAIALVRTKSKYLKQHFLKNGS